LTREGRKGTVGERKKKKSPLDRKGKREEEGKKRREEVYLDKR